MQHGNSAPLYPPRMESSQLKEECASSSIIVSQPESETVVQAMIRALCYGGEERYPLEQKTTWVLNIQRQILINH